MENLLLNIIRFWLDSTPPYYYMIYVGMAFVVVLCLTQLYLVCFARCVKRQYGFGTVIASVVAVMFLYGCISFSVVMERPNLDVYFGDDVQARIKDDRLDYSQCVFGNQDYKQAKRLGLKRYAEERAARIKEEAGRGSVAAFRCGRL